MASGSSSVFCLDVRGQIESAEFQEFDNIYCKYEFVYGQDWVTISGLEEGITQTVLKGHDTNQTFVFNFPIDISFKSTNPHGWPQLVIQCFGQDAFGNDVIRGYAVVHIPITPGRHTRKIAAFVPQSSSLFQRFLGWLMSRKPEYHNPRCIAQGDGREMTRTRTQGSIKLSFNILQKDMKKMGYDVTPSDTATPSTSAMPGAKVGSGDS